MTKRTSLSPEDRCRSAVRWLVGALVFAAGGMALACVPIPRFPSYAVQNAILTSVLVVDPVLWVVGASLYARSIGRSGLLGLLGLLGPLGLFVLWLLPSRAQDEIGPEAPSHLTNYPR